VHENFYPSKETLALELSVDKIHYRCTIVNTFDGNKLCISGTSTSGRADRQIDRPVAKIVGIFETCVNAVEYKTVIASVYVACGKTYQLII
jgi:hypothetical protein